LNLSALNLSPDSCTRLPSPSNPSSTMDYKASVKRELSEKELEAAPALLMLLSRNGDSTLPQPSHQQASDEEEEILVAAVKKRPSNMRHLCRRSHSATFALSSSATAKRGKRDGGWTPSSPQPRHQHQEPRVPGRHTGFPSMGNGTTGSSTKETEEKPRTKLSIYSLLNQDDSDFAAPTCDVDNRPRNSSYSSLLPPILPSLSSLLFASDILPSEIDTAEKKPPSRSGSNQRALLQSSLPSQQAASTKQEPRAAKRRKPTPSSPSLNPRSSRKTKKQIQLELLHSVNSSEGSYFHEDRFKLLRPSLHAPSILTVVPPTHQDPPHQTEFNGETGETKMDDKTTSSSNSSVSISSISSSDQFLRVPLDRQQEQEQHNRNVPVVSVGSNAPSDSDSRSINVKSMPKDLSIKINLSPNHTKRFADKKRQRRDSFSLTYPTGSDFAGDKVTSAPLLQHQHEFIQQLLQQIHQKRSKVADSPKEGPRSDPFEECPKSPFLMRCFQATKKPARSLSLKSSRDLSPFLEELPPHSSNDHVPVKPKPEGDCSEMSSHSNSNDSVEDRGTGHDGSLEPESISAFLEERGSDSCESDTAFQRKKASPQQMAILEQIWTTTAVRQCQIDPANPLGSPHHPLPFVDQLHKLNIGNVEPQEREVDYEVIESTSNATLPPFNPIILQVSRGSKDDLSPSGDKGDTRGWRGGDGGQREECFSEAMRPCANSSVGA
jgi:hypothetical protein